MSVAQDHLPPARFSFLTPLYDIGCSLLGFGKRFRREIVAQVPPGKAVLDVGCGTGVMTRLVKSTYPEARVLGLDPDERALGIAARKGRNDVSFIRGYAEKLPFKEGEFDVLTSTLAVHHIPGKREAFKEFHRVLKKGGMLVIADFGPEVPWLLRWFAACFENGKENVEGRLPAMLKQAGFKDIVTSGGLPWGVEIIKARR